MSKLCTSKDGCVLCECDENEIPVSWRKVRTSTGRKKNEVDGFLNNLQKKVVWNAKNCESWTPRPCEESLKYVNLMRNPHSNTGYQGPGATRIWRAIYEENCFKEGDVSRMCHEEKLFFKVLSGLHHLTTLAVASYFNKIKESSDNISNNNNKIYSYCDFTPNIQMFESKILNVEGRMENIYTLYSFVSQAIQRISPFLRKYEDFKVMLSDEEDQTTQILISKLLDSHEKNIFFNVTDVFQKMKPLEQQMKSYFYNISLILNCVECEKCKMWSKMEFLGLSVAFKIFLSDETYIERTFDSLNRNEIIALFNLFFQSSRAITNYNNLSVVIFRKNIAPKLAFGICITCFSFLFSSILTIIFKKIK